MEMFGFVHARRAAARFVPARAHFFGRILLPNTGQPWGKQRTGALLTPEKGVK
jgi:hypothetical protein